MSYSELQAGVGSRRSAQVMVIPLANAATPGQRLPESPNLLIINDRPSCAGPWTALAKLAAGVLQRRFSALPRSSTRRLNTVYIIAGLILLLFLIPTELQAANSCVVLQYHHFSESTPRITSITPVQFDAQLNYLAANNFHVMALRDVVLSLRHQIALPDKCVSFSIDDAYLSVYTSAYPALSKRGWPFTVFVNSKAVDDKQKAMMNWQQMREMAKHGASFENHSHTHLHMIRHKRNEGEAHWLQRIQRDIETAQQRIIEEIGVAPTLFAWPYGEFNPALEKLISVLGLTGFGQQSGPLWPDADMSALPRFPMEAQYADLKGFITKVNSLPLPLVSATPKDPLLPIAKHRPTLTLQLAPGRYSRANLRCYLDGSDKVSMRWSSDETDVVHITPLFDLQPGRHRSNCTMPSNQQGRFHWYSHNWFVRKDNGDWYAEY